MILPREKNIFCETLFSVIYVYVLIIILLCFVSFSIFADYLSLFLNNFFLLFYMRNMFWNFMDISSISQKSISRDFAKPYYSNLIDFLQPFKLMTKLYLPDLADPSRSSCNSTRRINGREKHRRRPNCFSGGEGKGVGGDLKK